MCVPSDGNPYGIADGLIFSFPCRSNGNGDWEIVGGFELDDYLTDKVKATEEELLNEKDVIKDLLG